MDPTVTTNADGVTITAEVELPPDDDQDLLGQVAAPATSDPVADILGGVARGVRSILGGIWDAIKPDDSAPPPEED